MNELDSRRQDKKYISRKTDGEQKNQKRNPNAKGLAVIKNLNSR